MEAFVCLPKLKLTKAKINREIYVVSIGTDLRGESNHRPPAVGSDNETLKKLTPEIQAAMKLAVIAVSNVFHNIDKDQAVSLSGDGIVLYPPADPQGMLALHLAVVESDKGSRDIGKLLKGIFADKDVKDLLKEITTITAASRGIPADLLTTFMGVAVKALTTFLENNEDDILFSHGHAGRAISKYGGSAEGRDYAIGNKKVEATLRVHAAE